MSVVAASWRLACTLSMKNVSRAMVSAVGLTFQGAMSGEVAMERPPSSFCVMMTVASVSTQKGIITRYGLPARARWLGMALLLLLAAAL